MKSASNSSSSPEAGSALKNHYIPQFIQKNFSENYRKERILLVNLDKQVGGFSNIKSAFKFKGMYPPDVEKRINDALENKVSVLFKPREDGKRTLHSDRTVVLRRSDLHMIRKFVIIQMLRTPVGRNMLKTILAKDQNRLFKLASDDRADGETEDGFWCRIMSTVLDVEWKDLGNTDIGFLNMLVNNINCLQPVIIRTREYLPLPDTGLVFDSIHITPRYDPGMDVDVRNTFSKDVGADEAKDFVTSGGSYLNFIGLPFDSHHLLILADDYWRVRRWMTDIGMPVREILHSEFEDYLRGADIVYVDHRVHQVVIHNHDQEVEHDDNDLFIIQTLTLPEGLEMRLRQMCIDSCMEYFGFTTVDGISDLVAVKGGTVDGRSLTFIPNTDFSQPYEDNLRKKSG